MRSDPGTGIDLTAVVETLFDGAKGSGSLLRDGRGSTVGSVIGTTGGFLSGSVLAIVVLYYLLKDGPMLIDGMVRRFTLVSLQAVSVDEGVVGMVDEDRAAEGMPAAENTFHAATNRGGQTRS